MTSEYARKQSKLLTVFRISDNSKNNKLHFYTESDNNIAYSYLNTICIEISLLYNVLQKCAATYTDYTHSKKIFNLYLIFVWTDPQLSIIIIYNSTWWI